MQKQEAHKYKKSHQVVEDSSDLKMEPLKIDMPHLELPPSPKKTLSNMKLSSILEVLLLSILIIIAGLDDVNLRQKSYNMESECTPTNKGDSAIVEKKNQPVYSQ